MRVLKDVEFAGELTTESGRERSFSKEKFQAKMIRRQKIPFLLYYLLIFMTPQLGFAEDSESTQRMVICRNTTAVRTLRVEKNPGDHCQTYYTKAGIDQNIGKSQSMHSCVEYLNKVRETLVKAKWNCKDVKVSTLSTLTETVN